MRRTPQDPIAQAAADALGVDRYEDNWWLDVSKQEAQALIHSFCTRYKQPMPDDKDARLLKFAVDMGAQAARRGDSEDKCPIRQHQSTPLGILARGLWRAAHSAELKNATLTVARKPEPRRRPKKG